MIGAVPHSPVCLYGVHGITFCLSILKFVHFLISLPSYISIPSHVMGVLYRYIKNFSAGETNSVLVLLG